MFQPLTQAIVLYDDPRQAPPTEAWEKYHQGLVGVSLSGAVSGVTPEVLHLEIPDGFGGHYPVTVGWEKAGRSLPDLNDHFRVGQPVAVRPLSVERPRDRWPRFAGALVKDQGAQPLPAPPAHLAINPESLRLGLLHELGPSVIGIAGMTPDRLRSPLGRLLKSGGWTLCGPGELAAWVTEKLAAVKRENPDVFLVIAGREDPDLAPKLGSVEICNPDVRENPPRIAGRPWTELPFAEDPELTTFPVPEGAAERAAPQLFVAAWTVGYDAPKEKPRAPQLAGLGALYPDRPDLVLSAQHELNERGASQREGDLGRLERARALLTSLPAHPTLARDVIRAILQFSEPTLAATLEAEFLPVAPLLLPFWKEQRVHDLLGRVDGVQNLGRIGSLIQKLGKDVPGAAVHRMLHDEADAGLLDFLSLLPADVARMVLLETVEAHHDDIIDGLSKDPDKFLVARYTPDAWKALRKVGITGDQMATFGPGYALLLLDGKKAGFEPHDLVELARDLATEPRELLRDLVPLPPALWGQIPKNRALIKSWWRRHQDFDVLAVLERIPDLAAWEEHLGAEGIRLLQRSGSDQVRLHFADRLSRTLGRDLVPVLDRVVGLEHLPAAEVLDGEPGASFLRHYFEQRPLSELFASIADGAPERWIAYGEAGLSSRDRDVLLVASAMDLLPEELPTTAGMPAIARRLASDPDLARAVSDLEPALRVSLLPHLPELPNGAHVLDMPALAAAKHPPSAARLALGAGISVTHAARLSGAEVSNHVEALSAIGPILGDLSSEAVKLLLALDIPKSGRSTLALMERERAGGIEIVHKFGTALAPLICGPNGRSLIELLRGLSAAPRAGAWLEGGGHGAVDALRELGQPLLDLVQATEPHPRDTRILREALHLTQNHVETAARFYRLVTTHGIPAACWPRVAELLRAGRRDQYVLETLFMKGMAP